MERINDHFDAEIDEEEEKRLDRLSEIFEENALKDGEALKSEIWSCEVGDVLEVISYIEFSEIQPQDGSDAAYWAELQPQGQLYRVVDLKGRGFDLELLSGEGPREIRAMNWEIPGKFRVMPQS